MLAGEAELGFHEQHSPVVPHLDDHPRVHTGPLGDALDAEVVDAPGYKFVQRGVMNRLPLRLCCLFHSIVILPVKEDA